MEKKTEIMPLIDLEDENVKQEMFLLLKDRTTNNNIVWATNNYESHGKGYSDTDEITSNNLYSLDKNVIQPRVFKSAEIKASRTKSKAEVFTPSWVCNDMNNMVDEEWFGYKNVFNKKICNSWETNKEKVRFPENKTLDDYIESTRLEITCGEAPFLVSRYDSSTGDIIPIENRIGLLDRKLRLICENIDDKDEWFDKAVSAYKSIYGYEFQGDNLLIARINLLMTFVEYYEYKFKEKPENYCIDIIAFIISWNIWQMDGLKNKQPFSDKYATIMDWGANKEIEFVSLIGEEVKDKKKSSKKTKKES